ncbi:hypothetical protein ABTK80_20910, partial [Acinetobacter baumannii]
MGRTVPDYLKLRASFQAEKDLSGVYRFLLKLASPEMVALKLSRVATQIFEFGDTTVHRVAPNRIEGAFYGLPISLVEWL